MPPYPPARYTKDEPEVSAWIRRADDSPDYDSFGLVKYHYLANQQQTNGDYGDADKERAYQDALARWQQQLVDGHRHLAEVRQTIAQRTNRLRTLPDPYDARGADLLGCLADASSHLQQMPGGKYRYLAGFAQPAG